MGFIAILVAVLTHRHYGDTPSLQQDNWFRRWCAVIDSRLPGATQARLLVAVFVPVLGLMLVVHLIGGWWANVPVFILSLVTLLYSFGRGDADTLADTYCGDIRRADLQAAYHHLEGQRAEDRQEGPENWQQLHQQALRAIAYRYFERYFPTIFWFVILGPPGALMYRLAALYLDSAPEDEGRSARRLLWLLDWLPLRLTGIVLALVGNFASAMAAWQATLFDNEEAGAGLLERYVRGALGIDTPSGVDEETLHRVTQEVESVKMLFDRGLVMWLAAVALVTLLL